MVWEKRLDTKMSLPMGKCYLPMGKRASVTTTIVQESCMECSRGQMESQDLIYIYYFVFVQIMYAQGANLNQWPRFIEWI